ncbi:DUF1003 domain-containing protein [Chryseosolibacter indicus]|uniref:DUF1003 domain-containing protein n=1 Tax=Chryseosolibacter indicus TaxID=2782351 RepID=A0ABS5VP07_9BACT|nr:DUF1003 domain-containing protein [Chryseosolibacter indicus]MBT1702881.1 DUF1003 domain-containing protein [Chryseosolibacter indicus]
MQRETKLVERNIKALLERKRDAEKNKKWQDKLADTVTRFTGSITFVIIHLVLFSSWIIINLGLTPFKKFDPSFVVLAMFASVEAIFLSTFVLISQNRMAVLADKRADLDLHISLLSEHELTRLIKLVKDIAAKMDVQEAANPELPELEKDVMPEKVLDILEEKEKNVKSK